MHAAIEYAYLHGRPKKDEFSHPSVIHLSIPQKSDLESEKFRLTYLGIPISEFYEPYKSWGLTAIACLLTEDQRHHLSHLPLWSINHD